MLVSSNVCSLVTAVGNVYLRGHKFPPTHGPRRYPVCPRCKELVGMLGISSLG